MAILLIGEAHWTEAGQKRLASIEMLLYSRHKKENALYTQEVALMLSNEHKMRLLDGNLIGPESSKQPSKQKGGNHTE